ncbi:MAG: hypothetical protein F6J93_26625 [Oscillatoria sp. SIO1A7]|nr:hypothetical protein [Oscillatoria sp. SIO1A7]
MPNSQCPILNANMPNATHPKGTLPRGGSCPMRTCPISNLKLKTQNSKLSHPHSPFLFAIKWLTVDGSIHFQPSTANHLCTIRQAQA